MVAKVQEPCQSKHPLGFVCARLKGHKGEHVPVKKDSHFERGGTRVDSLGRTRAWTTKNGKSTCYACLDTGSNYFSDNNGPTPDGSQKCIVADGLLAELGASGLCDEVVCAPGSMGGYATIRVKHTGHKASVCFAVNEEMVALLLRGQEIFIVFPPERTVEV